MFLTQTLAIMNETTSTSGCIHLVSCTNISFPNSSKHEMLQQHSTETVIGDTQEINHMQPGMIYAYGNITWFNIVSHSTYTATAVRTETEKGTLKIMGFKGCPSPPKIFVCTLKCVQTETVLTALEWFLKPFKSCSAS